MAIRSVSESALSGIARESERFERSAAKLTRLAGAPSAAETAETVQISPEAREASQNMEQGLGTGLESALVDTRVAKYAFMANLKLLETGAEVERAALKIVEPRDE